MDKFSVVWKNVESVYSEWYLLHKWKIFVTWIFWLWNEKKLTPKSTLHKFLDRTNHYSLVSPLYYPSMTIYNTANIKFSNFIFNHYRTCDIFDGDKSSNALFDAMCKLYPDANINPNDNIFTCDKIYNRKWHNLLAQHFQPDKFVTVVDSHLKYILSKQYYHLSAIDLVRQYVVGNMCRMLFVEMDAVQINTISSVVQSLHNNTSSVLLGAPSTNAEVSELRSAIDTVIEKYGDKLFKLNDSELTLNQKRCMLFTLFGTCQERLITMMLLAVQKFIVDHGEQCNIYPMLVDCIANKFAKDSVHAFQPAFAIGRSIKKDIIMEIADDGRKEVLHLKKGDVLAVHIEAMKKGNGMTFGSGPHSCPGNQYVLYQIEAFVKYLVSNYIVTNIDTVKRVRMNKTYAITTMIDKKEDWDIRLIRRNISKK